MENHSYRRNPSQRKFQRPKGIIDGADFINSMPDDILHHILFFIPIDLAMRTSVLSRRWRHVWCEMPCLAIDEYILIKAAAGGVNQTLASYTASFKLRMRLNNTLPPPLIDSLVELAISRNVEKLSVTILDFRLQYKTYSFPDFFYLSSSLNQLSLSLPFSDMIPRCTVSWKSLRNLSLIECKLGQESTDNILSGCPVLESLTLYACRSLERLDLRKSLSLRRLEIYHSHPGRELDPSGPILSLAELRGDPFPTLKVQTLIIRTEFAQSVPGIARLLQNSPGLKKLTVYMMHGYNIMSRNLDQYWGLKYKVFAPSNDSYSMLGCNVATSKVLAWFMELVLRNAKTLENMVVWLRSRYFDDAQWFEEQLQIVGTLSHNNNVSILLKQKNF
ncbi:hypothetical protein F2Q69_00045800 [Brassica cretica]|uniref:F-box domain-containing protein n=1 Tax=Brassica cretica TaxID=69181 RepID=A0A8S9NLF0_BRACR|nr:hypothetical protein F2Q69_00045800 [Brassica cretica]